MDKLEPDAILMRQIDVGEGRLAKVNGQRVAGSPHGVA
jgi:hypothetical protein